jgi:hypothetical protein
MTGNLWILIIEYRTFERLHQIPLKNVRCDDGNLIDKVPNFASFAKSFGLSLNLLLPIGLTNVNRRSFYDHSA